MSCSGLPMSLRGALDEIHFTFKLDPLLLVRAFVNLSLMNIGMEL